MQVQVQVQAEWDILYFTILTKQAIEDGNGNGKSSR